MDHDFRCVAACPAAFGGASTAIATARAGGVGIIDLQFCRDDLAIRKSVAALMAGAPGDIGLRVDQAHVENLEALRTLMDARLGWLILADHYVTEFVLANRRDFPRARLLVEIRDADQLSALEGVDDISLVARGHEAGGWVGDDSTFILLQKLLRTESRPIFVQGGLGVNSAAACRAVGAAGVILDDQLLLMPESDLPRDIRRQLSACNGQNARPIGERLGATVRVISRPGFGAAAQLAALSDRAEAGDWTADQWRREAEALIGWGPPETHAWPVGQGLEIATALRNDYKTTGRLIRAIVEQSQRSLEIAHEARPLAEGGPLAESHGLRFPIFQGPMTRVSDSARFADEVSKAGGLPFLALALMTGEQSLKLLEDTKNLAGTRPWGVGLLGFIPKELRDRQIEAVMKFKPPVALIAGGRPDQAAVFEKEGIATYIHVPSPDLLRMFIDQGARRFVFEGRECGGHIGPLSSFVLWETQINALLEKVPASKAGDFHVLFAGGICDARSAAMVAVLAAPLVERGVRIGVLMGSAYLVTREIVETGAIVPEFQNQALACKRTISLESGPGHATRCAVTPFAHEFYSVRRNLLKSGASGDEIRDKLEDLNLGRLRIASKGKDRSGAEIVDVDSATQVQEGMYMIGQAATLRDDVVSVLDLHTEVSEGATQFLAEGRRDETREAAAPSPADIAVIGIGTLLPKAASAQAYWQNILNKTNAIGEIPKERFDWRLYFDADRKAKDKIYSRWGGFLDEIPFDPVRYGIPPNSLKSIDPLQLLTLEVVRRAMEDAGYEDGGYDKEKTSVILGSSGGLGDIGLQYGVRAEMPRIVEGLADADLDRLPEWTEESFAGCLPNVAAGRVANRFDFGGLNFTVDAACASSLAAVMIAVNELASGRSNIAIAGGIDTVQSPFSYMCFAKTSALSPTGQPRTFDAKGDGIVISEGLATVVLKRLADAQRDGDRIYAVIKAVSGSSDGKALGLTAPLPAGQKRALKRAYEQAGFSPNTLDLVEAHGTGTVVGDRAEAETIVDSLKAFGTPAKNCAVGSVKTILGHTKGTAGIAGLIKVALSLHHKVLPPHFGVDAPIAPIAADDSPVYLLKEPRPWHRHPDHPRRGASSAFGFGGTNFHAVLEEYEGEFRAEAQPAGASEWPSELFVFRGADKADLERQIARVHDALQAGATMRLSDLAYSLALAADAQGSKAFAASVVARDLASLASELGLLLKDLRGEPRKTLPPYVSLSLGAAVQNGDVAFLFPGQGAQHPDMAREAALYVPALREAIEAADTALKASLPRLLSRYIHPHAAFSAEATEKQKADLTDTRIAQPAIGAVSLGFLDFARQLGLNATMMAGHSYGELTALHAAGVLSRDDFFRLSGLRGRVMADACNAEVKGVMAVVRATRKDVEAALADHSGLVLANHNAPDQTVVSGPVKAVEAFVTALAAKGLDARLLPVAGAFHSPLMASIKADLDRGIEAIDFRAETATVFSNTSGRPYPEAGAAKQRILTDHLLNSVEFVAEIEAMHAAGARVFIELGPKSILTGLTSSILKDREHLAVSFDGAGLRGVLSAVGALAVKSAASLRLANLFAGRIVNELNLARLAPLRLEEALTPTTWFLSGGCVRPQKEPVRKTGRTPMLALEDRTALKARQAARAESAGAIAASAPAIASSLNGAAPMANGAAPHATGAHAPAVAPHAAPAPAPAYRTTPPAGGPAGALDVVMAYQDTMRQFISVQEQIMTAFLSGQRPSAGAAQPVAAAAPMARPAAPTPPVMNMTPPAPQPATSALNGAHWPAAAPAPAPAAPAPSPAAAGLDRAALTTLLLEQVSERTGYPPEMLGLDQDIEAELGIDSIKRVEILGALQDRLPAAMTERLKAGMETLTRVKTLNGLIDNLGVATPLSAPAATPAASASAANNGAGLDRAALTALLLEQVSERTGYPTEMLGLDQDIEAELGIDSIKRVEILGALQDRLPASMTERLKAGMETLTRVKTLNGLIDNLSVGAPAGAAPAAPVAAASAAVNGAGLDRAALTSLLLEQVSERTGYPTEMLGLDQDIEAELGIDSIKRVEILGALQDRLPAAMTERLKAGMETLTRVKTLNGLIDNLSVAPAPHAAPRPAPAAEPVSKPNSVSAARGDLPRFHMMPVAAPLDGGAVQVAAGHFLITEDGLGVARLVAQKLEALGATSRIVEDSLLSDRSRLAAWKDHEKQSGRVVSGVIHLSPLTDRPALADWQAAADANVKSFWALLNAFGEDLLRSLVRGSAFVIAASRMDGAFGRSSSDAAYSPTAGGAVGLVKTAAAEWKGLTARAVDFAANITPAEIAQAVIDELQHAGPDLEIGYVGAGERVAFRTDRAPFDTGHAGLQVGADWVVLITGGARGITAKIAEAVAVPGAHFVLAGRTPVATREAADTSHLRDAGALRAALVEKAKAEGRKVAPTAIEAEVRKILAEREVRETLARLGAGGVKADYRDVDVRDEAAFGELIDNLYKEHGRIDAVIHGAGVIEDRLITDKTAESFDRVFDTKCAGAFVLAKALRPESLKFISFFTSVAGRYGNRGQGDYAAANETLNRLAWSLHRRWPKVRVASVNWGPWNAPGMASAEIKRQFEKRGLVAIELDDGCKFFVDEMKHGRLEDVEVVAGVGPWRHEMDSALAVAPKAKRAPKTVANGSIATRPLLIHAARGETADGYMSFEHTLDLEYHQYMDDHRLDGTPVLPAAAAAEWMAQIAQQAWPDWHVAQISNLRVLKGLRLDGSQPKAVTFRARASSHADAGEMKASLTLGAPDSPVLYYKCTTTLVSRMAQPVDASLEPLTAGRAIDPSDAYRQYLFHGPRFQLIRSIDRLGLEGIDAEVAPSKPSQWMNGNGSSEASWLFDPGLVDAALQTVLVWSRVQLDTTPLPSSFGALTRFDQDMPDEPIRLRCRIRPGATETKIGFDAQFIDRDGKLRMLLENIEVTGSKALNRLGG